MTTVTIADLTQATLEGTGVFDVLMRANKAHLESEFSKGRIKGPEYSAVYLGSLEAVMTASLAFITQSQKVGLEAALLEQQILNAQAEHDVLVAQKCKLQAEYDVLILQKDKIAAETALLDQKTATEKGQILELGVDENSVIGRQKQLYLAQTNGFARDAEQKVAKVMVDSWNVRRTTDEATVADGTNMLNDTAVGRAVNKLLDGVGA